jgi:hypothetical protein
MAVTSASFTSISSDTGASSDFVTSDSTLILNGTFTGTGSDNGLFIWMSSNNGVSWTRLPGSFGFTASGGGASTLPFSYDNTGTTLPDGSYLFRINHNNNNPNNQVVGTSSVITVDTVAPTAVATIGGLSADNGSSSSDFITNSATQTVSGSYTGTLGAGESIQVSANGGSTWVTATADAVNHTWSAAGVVLSSAPGSSLQVRTTDLAANVTAGANNPNYTLDTTAPSLSIASAGGSDNVVSGQTGDNIVSGTADVGSSVVLSIGARALDTVVATGGAWSYGLTSDDLQAIGQGGQTLTATTTDTAGNVTTRTFGFVVDTLAPSAPAITVVHDDVNPGQGDIAQGLSTNDTDLTVTVALEGTGAVAGDTIQLFDGSGTGQPLGFHALSGSEIEAGFATVQTGTLLANATYDLTARVIDEAGNASGASGIWQVVEDPTAVCFAAGTRILTDRGEIAVEMLHQADLVMTLDGGELSPRPVKWIGTRRIDLAAHRDPKMVAPVRVQPGAFGDNRPHTELLLSPDHAVFVDGKLIAVRLLINGGTIHQDLGCKAVTYYHIEIDRHSVLLAEGLPVESYLDTGNRGFFANSGEPLVLHPDLTDEADYPDRAAGSCAPFVWDEATVKPIWGGLAKRGAELGRPAQFSATTTDPALSLLVKGRTVRPVYRQDGLHAFVLPKGTTELRLVSRAGSPADVSPWLDDRRMLGVYVERIVLRDGAEVNEAPVDHPLLTEGWWGVERSGTMLRRWTNGSAVLRLPESSQAAVLEIRIRPGLQYVVEAADSAAA